MKPYSHTSSVLSTSLNTPNLLGSNDYFSQSRRPDGAQSTEESQKIGAAGKEELPILNSDALQNRSVAQSFIDVLPNELLSVILEHGYLDFRDGPSPQIPDTNFRSLMLETCHKLRQIALNTPSLWSVIHLTPGNIEDKLDDLPRYLERSAQYLLDIHLACFWDEDVTKSVLNHLIPHSKRWRRLSIVTVNHFCLSLLENVPVPFLEDLDVSYLAADRRISLPPTFLDDTPRLVHLCLRNIDLDPMRISVHNLKTLEIRGYGTWPRFLQVREMLEGLKDLKKLVLHVKPGQAIHEMQVNEDREQARVLLSALRTLEVYTSEGLSSRIVELLRIFTCPKLESFVLREGVGSASETSRTIMSYTSTAHRHKDTSLYDRLGGEELCTGNPNRMFVHAATMDGACEILPSSMLTSLELRKPVLPYFATTKATLSQLKNLRHLYFFDMDPNASIGPLVRYVGNNANAHASFAKMESQIDLPSLETFVLEMAPETQTQNPLSPDYTAEFLSIFRLRGLRALTLKNVKPRPLQKIISYFSKQSNPLTSLQLVDITDVVPIDPENLLALSFPHLRRLVLNGVSSNSFIHQLCPSSLSLGPHAGSLPWPEIEDLSICNDRNVSRPLLHRIVSEREKLGKPLLNLYLDHQLSLNQDSWSWLNEHVKVGLARPGFL